MIEVSLPDGSIAQFPDGTPRDVMEGAISSHLSPSWSDVPGNAMRNIVPSAKRFAGDMVDAFSSPIETAKAMGNVALGAAQKLIPGEQDSEKYADAVGQYFSDRYGSMDGFKRALSYDPVGVLADMSTVFTGGAGAAKGIAKGAQLAGKAGLAEGIGRAAELAGTAANMTDPIALAGKGLGAVGRGVSAKAPDALKRPFTPEGWYQSGLKPTGDYYDAKNAVDVGLRERIPPTMDGMKKLQDLQSSLGEEVGGIIDNTPNATVNLGDVANTARGYVGDTYQYHPQMDTVTPQAQEGISAFSQAHGSGDVDLRSAQNLKLGAQNASQKAFDTPTRTPLQEGNVALSRALREAIETEVPGVAPLNQRLSGLHDLKPQLEGALKRSGNWDLGGLSVGLGGGGGLGYAVGGPAGALVGATLGNILRQPGTKANIAFGLDSARSAMNSPTAQLMEQVFSEIRPPATAGAYAGERAKESYADMLRRYGVNITLGQ